MHILLGWLNLPYRQRSNNGADLSTARLPNVGVLGAFLLILSERLSRYIGRARGITLLELPAPIVRAGELHVVQNAQLNTSCESKAIKTPFEGTLERRFENPRGLTVVFGVQAGGQGLPPENCLLLSDQWPTFE